MSYNLYSIINGDSKSNWIPTNVMDQMAIPDAAHKREPHKDPKRFSKAPRYVHILIIQLQKLLEFWVAFPKINIFISVIRSLVLFALDSYQAENGQQLTNIEQLSGSTIVSPGQLYCFAPIQVVKYIESGPQKTLLSG